MSSRPESVFTPRAPLPRMLALLLLATSGGLHAQSNDSLIDPDGYRGLVADHRAYRVGDVLTIQVLETARAKSQALTDAGSRLDLDAGLNAPGTDYDATLGLGGANTATAQTTRLGELRTRISARVLAVEPNGDLRIEGEQSLVVNGERQHIRIAGRVRPADIAADNSVWSHRIADADLELAGVGTVGASQRQSILYRALKWLRLL